jgi:Clp amino terminal domain, pathogenicity island component/ClpX C4-type zinc finger
MDVERWRCQAGSVFERFTDSARQVLVLAQEEARLLGHSFIGTEHILLGLIHADGGTASQVLTELGASLPTVRERVEETIGLTGGAPSGSPPFTPRAKKVMELSLREALQLGHHNIGTEHMLLGLVREGEGVGAQVLVSLGIDLGEVRQRVLQHLAETHGAETHGAESSGGSTRNVLIRGEGAAARRRTRARVVTCSFCGLGPPESGQLISGDNAFICENCVRRWSMRLGPPSTSVSHTWVSRTPLETAPTGFEPEGADAARAEISAAYGGSRAPSDDGRSVPTVENGDDLGPTLVLANERTRGIVGDGSDVIISADEIHFYDPERAAVVFSISLGDRLLLGGQQGDAVLVDGVWKMARSTFARLMTLAGVACPPASD